MHLVRGQDAPVHSTRGCDGPTITVLFGGNRDSDQVGMVRVAMPPNTRMPSHRHGGSDTILAPVSGSVRITKADEVIDLGPGDALLILKYESVTLENPHQQPAEVLVAAGPAGFVSAVRRAPSRDSQVIASS